jgi:hypothetical protein
MQFQGMGKPPLGVVFDCDMGNTIDDALALAMLYGLQGKNAIRVISVSINKPNLKAAAFCDVVSRFYLGDGGGFLPPSPIGMTLAARMDPDAAMAAAPLARQTPEGKPQYSCGIAKLNDTADPVAQIRNALTAQVDQNAVVVLAGSAANLAGVLDLPGTRELIVKKVKFLCATNFGRDSRAARKLLTEWPTEIVYAPPDLGEALPYPGASIEKDFAWSPAHPIVDAYRAYKPMPYDAPSWAMTAALHAGRPTEADFKLSDPGTLAAADDGRITFTPSANGKHRQLILDPAQKEKIIALYTELVSAKPVPRAGRGRFPQQKKKQ